MSKTATCCTKVIAFSLGIACSAQLMTMPVCATPFPQDDEQIPLVVEQDLPLPQFIEFVADQLTIKIIYTETELNQADTNARIYLRGVGATDGVTRDELLTLLKSSLRAKGLALVDAEVPNWKRIVQIGNARPYVPQGTSAQFETGDLITQVFELKNVSVAEARQLISPFLSFTTNNPDSIDRKNLLIVTDFVSNMRRVEERIELIDAPPEQVVRIFRDVLHSQASDLKSRLDEILGSATSSVNPENADANQQAIQGNGEDSAVQVFADERTNRILLVGQKARVEDIERLIDELDVSLGLVTRVYDFNDVSASRIDELIRQMIGAQQVEVSYNAVIEENANRLIVRATRQVHDQIAALQNQLDRSPSGSSQDGVDGQTGSVRYYRPRFVKVRDILDTLQAVERNRLESPGQFGNSRGSSTRGIQSIGNPFENTSPLSPFPPFNAAPQAQFPQNDQQLLDPLQQEQPTQRFDNSSQSVLPGEARITVDENSNTLIVVADPSVQDLYRNLIEWLDKPRPQVLIEARIVSVDASDDYTIGIELSGGDSTGTKRAFGFSSHGLSTVDATTGALTLLPGLGFNGTLIDPDVADLIVRALASHDRSRVVTAPRILVNDNATGELSSVDEVPFTSINAANTVSTTSFAGFAEAGTTISVTPHVSEGDHLQLEFRVTVNDFTGAGAAGVPPPRQTNEIVSEVTIPDGHTVIVGGLRRKRQSQDVSAIPIIERIPIINLLGSRETTARESDAVFIFIKAVILRDDKFSDLRIMSQQERYLSGIPNDMPYSEPVLIR